MSVNKAIILGHVGADPKMVYPEKGVAVAQIRVATNERMPGSNMERTEWHTIVLGGRNAEIAERYIRKGSLIYAEGKIRTRAWEDKTGIRHNVTEIYADTIELLGRQQ